MLHTLDEITTPAPMLGDPSGSPIPLVELPPPLNSLIGFAVAPPVSGGHRPQLLLLPGGMPLHFRRVGTLGPTRQQRPLHQTPNVAVPPEPPVESGRPDAPLDPLEDPTGARRINADANGPRDRQPHQEAKGFRPSGGGPPSFGG
eukprot:5729446-Alexandrium_andersonii.AAC.1